MARSPGCPRCGSRTLARDFDYLNRLVPSCLSCGWQDTPTYAEAKRIYEEQLPLVRNVGIMRT